MKACAWFPKATNRDNCLNFKMSNSQCRFLFHIESPLGFMKNHLPIFIIEINIIIFQNLIRYCVNNISLPILLRRGQIEFSFSISAFAFPFARIFWVKSFWIKLFLKNKLLVCLLYYQMIAVFIKIRTYFLLSISWCSDAYQIRGYSLATIILFYLSLSLVTAAIQTYEAYKYVHFRLQVFDGSFLWQV